MSHLTDYYIVINAAVSWLLEYFENLSIFLN